MVNIHVFIKFCILYVITIV